MYELIVGVTAVSLPFVFLWTIAGVAKLARLFR